MKKAQIKKTKDIEVVLYTSTDWEGNKQTKKCFPYSELDNLIQRSTNSSNWDIDYKKYFNSKEELEDNYGISIVGIPQFKSNRKLIQSGIGIYISKGFQHSDNEFSDVIELSHGFRNWDGLICLLGRMHDLQDPSNSDAPYSMKDHLEVEIADDMIMLNNEYLNY